MNNDRVLQVGREGSCFSSRLAHSRHSGHFWIGLGRYLVDVEGERCIQQGRVGDLGWGVSSVGMLQKCWMWISAEDLIKKLIPSWVAVAAFIFFFLQMTLFTYTLIYISEVGKIPLLKQHHDTLPCLTSVQCNIIHFPNPSYFVLISLSCHHSTGDRF